MLLLAALPLASTVSTDVLQALHDGRDLIVGRASMCVLPSRLITGDEGICGMEPCWLGKNTRESLDLRAEGDRQKKVSKDSYAGVLVSGATQHSNYKGSRGDLIDERILRVIRLLSPEAYFFAIERESRYEVVATPSILAPNTLPAGVRPEQLVIVWRRVGLSFLLHRVDLDLCPSWEQCALGHPKLPATAAAAFDAARAKPLGDSAITALSAACKPPAAPAAPAASSWLDRLDRWLLPEAPMIEAVFTKDECRIRDIAGTEAAFAASSFPAFPSSGDWVLAASSRYRRRAKDGSWECITPPHGKRCWRDEAAALAAVKRAEEQNPGYTLAQRAFRDDDWDDNDRPIASRPDYYAGGKLLLISPYTTPGGLEFTDDIFNYPIPGEKPYAPDGTSSFWDQPHDIGPKAYMRYPQYMFAGLDVLFAGSSLEAVWSNPIAKERGAGCAHCLDIAAAMCKKCQDREDECLSQCPQRMCPRTPDECTQSQLKFDPTCDECGYDLNGYRIRSSESDSRSDGGLYQHCQVEVLRDCRRAAECMTWSGRLDPK